MAKVKLVGFDELERALVEELPKATAKNVLRRAGMAAMKRIEDHAKQLVPVDKGTIRDSIKTKATKAKRVSRTRFASSNSVSVSTGPSGRPEGGNPSWQEYGTVKMIAQPYMRPAADAEADNVVNDLGKEIGAQIEKARKRIARKLARGL